MTRHARNCTAGAVYTYHEKKKDAETSGYGTNHRRIGKDSVKSFDCCSLSLQPCHNPVITKDGYLFDKESILQYIITKKNEYSRKLKEYERQKRLEDSEIAENNAVEEQKKLQKFINTEHNIVGSLINQPGSSSSVSAISNMTNGKEKELPSFWVPSQTPAAKISKSEKPDHTILCPISQRPLKAKDLINVKFTLVSDPDDKKSLIVKDNRYMCAVTHDVLSNSVPCVVLRTTGDVVTLECYEKLIKKDMIHPLTNQKLKEKDIIFMERRLFTTHSSGKQFVFRQNVVKFYKPKFVSTESRLLYKHEGLNGILVDLKCENNGLGGTGYSTTNDALEGKEKRPALQV